MPDTEIIEGLHTCKPINTPHPDDIKTFLVTNETSQRTGNQWTKIVGKPPDQGGRPYKVISVKPTGRKDNYGNVSYNLEISPTDAPPTHQNPRQSVFPAQQCIPSQGTPRQFLMRECNLYCLAIDAFNATILTKIGDVSDQMFDAIVGRLYTAASKQNLGMQMPEKPVREDDEFEPDSEENPI